MTTADDLASLRAENMALRGQLGLNGDGKPTRECLFREIARGLLLDDDAVRSVKKFGFEESYVRLDLLINGEARTLDIPVRRLFTVTIVRGYVAEVCNVALPYDQKQWTRIANSILSAAEQCPGYSRDTETTEWLIAFTQRVFFGYYGSQYAQRISDGAAIYERIIAVRSRRAGGLEAGHTGEFFFVRRLDDGISFSQVDFIGFVWSQMNYRLSRGELYQRLVSISFWKATQSARKGSLSTKLKACWHSPPGWLQEHEVDLPEPPPSRRTDGRRTDEASV